MQGINVTREYTTMRRFLIISLALNGYQFTYRNNLKTHKVYAKKLGADYLLVSKPWVSKLGVECCWLKLHLAKRALELGFDNVLLLDADAWVNIHCPDIRQELRPNKHMYMAKGYSERFNSGVMLLNNHRSCIDLINQIIDNRLISVPEEDSVGWGENGHVIYFSKSSRIVQEISECWNNTYRNDDMDYIRHQNHGPLRTGFSKRMLHKLLAMTSRGYIKLYALFDKNEQHHIPKSWFDDEVQHIVSRYAILRTQVNN